VFVAPRSKRENEEVCVHTLQSFNLISLPRLILAARPFDGVSFPQESIQSPQVFVVLPPSLAVNIYFHALYIAWERWNFHGTQTKQIRLQNAKETEKKATHEEANEIKQKAELVHSSRGPDVSKCSPENKASHGFTAVSAWKELPSSIMSRSKSPQKK